MMKRLYSFFTILATFFILGGCSQKPVVLEDEEQPRFWTWGGYNPNKNWDSLFTKMVSHGFKGLLISADSAALEKIIPIADKHGIHVHAWIWSINGASAEVKEKHPDWFSVNRLGYSVLDSMAYVKHYNFLCPIVPGAREYIKDKYRKLLNIKGLKGISMDYHRFVDVILPEKLWSKYDIIQDKEYPQWDYGYHPMMISEFKKEFGYSPLDLEDPSTDDKWLQFRCDQVTSLANEIADLARESGKMITASPFPTPKMSRKMVRQDWGKWELDLAFPMIYYGCYTDDINFIDDCVQECLTDKYPSTEIYCGLFTANFKEHSIVEGARRAFKNGAKGVAVYTYDGMSEEDKAGFKALADSLDNLKK